MSISFDLQSLPEGIQLGLFFLFGICIGSFLNVVVYRLPRGKSLLKPSSRCGFCRSAISGWRNIPIVSFLMSGGSCAKCGHFYSARYVIVEFLTGMIFLGVGSFYGASLTGVLFALFASAIIAMTFIDIEFRIIPDEISIGGWIVALAIAALAPVGYPISLTEAVIGSLAGFGFFWLVSRAFYRVTQEVGLGGGDIKLLGFIGAVVGLRGVITTILVGSLMGSVFAISWILIARKTRKAPIPFGPFLGIGALVAIFQLDQWWLP